MTNRRPNVSSEGRPEKAERWGAEKRQALKLWRPRAVYFAAPDVMMWLTTQPVGGGAITQHGGNRGFRPMRVGTTRSWADTATRLHDMIPHVKYAKPRRLWLHVDAEVSRLVKAATDLVSHAAEEAGYDVKLGHGLLNLGPDIDLEQLVMDVREVARRRKVLTWDDADLSLFIDRVLRFAKAKGIAIVDHRGRGINHRGFINLMDRSVEHECRQQLSERTVRHYDSQK